MVYVMYVPIFHIARFAHYKPNKQNNMNYHWIVFLAGVLGLVPSQMSSQPNDQMCAAKFSVIGAGLSKTGTQSIKRALESANHQVYNVESMMARRELDQVVAIHAAEPEQRAQLVSQFVHQLLDDGYDATMDIPFSFLVEDCLKLDNTSTVLLSVRDSAETWFSSVEQTFDAFAGLAGWPFVWWFDFPEYASHVWQCQHSVETFQPWYLPWVKLTHRYVLDQSCVDFYTMHNNQVRQLAERYQAKLVEFNVKQGWQGYQPDQPAKPAKSLSMVGVLAGVVVVAVIALIIVVVYFVAVRKCSASLDCSLSSGDNISCTANSTNTACVCTYSGGTNTDCTSCQPATFDFNDPATYVSCTSSGCTGTLGPQGSGMYTWGTGKTCTNLGTDVAVTIALGGDALNRAVISLDGTNTSDATWGKYSTWCSTNPGGCVGFSITPWDGAKYMFTPCGKAASGASYVTGTDAKGYSSSAFLYLPNSLPSTSQQQQQQQQQQQHKMQPVKSKLPGWSA